MRKATGQIDVEIHPKKRMLTAQVADFPMIFSVRRTVAEERLAEPFRVWSFRMWSLFGRNLLPGNRRNTLLISAFFAKSIATSRRP